MNEKDILMTEGSLSDSFIYKSFNSNSEMTSTIFSAIKDSIIIDNSYIEEQLMQIARTRISPLAEEVVKAYNNGEITILYSKNKKVPQVFPFFVTKIRGVLKSIIFINNYGTISKSETDSSKKYLNISMKDLYVLMEGAYTAREYILYPAKMNKSLQLMRICSSIYTNMIIRILNKEYALSLDLNASQAFTFCISKFFMENVWMHTNDDVINTYARGNIIGAYNQAAIMSISDLYDSKNIKTIDELFALLKEISPRIKGLTFRYFLQCYINTYKVSAMFGLECLPYFLFTIETTMIGSFIVNQPMISDVTKTTKNMNQFYPELVKALQ